MEFKFRWIDSKPTHLKEHNVLRMARFVQPMGARIVIMLSVDGLYRIADGMVNEFYGGFDHEDLQKRFEGWVAFERSIGSTEAQA